MNNNFAENLRKIRKEKNLSQEQLAEQLGVSRQAISKWESAVAYPEMDKIIALCNRFDLNIDDLLHKDIKEVRGEEESKKNLNKYIDDFLEFITDTINLFSNMNFKSRLKCLFEQIIVITILLLLSLIVKELGDYVISSLLGFLPDMVYHYVSSIFQCIYVLLIIVVSIIILVHIFKIRYLDYYDKLKKEMIDDREIDLKNNIGQDVNDNNKILYKRNENKIIIRDPKHSEYRFINGLLKLIVRIIKFFALCFSILLSIILVGLFCLLVMSFLIAKTGIFFGGLLISIISAGIIDIVFILIVFNFVFNRKNNKKKMIWTFIVSLITLGVGFGLIFIGSLNFDVEDNENMLTTSRQEFEMNDDLFFDTYYEINYVESDIPNIIMEYKINKYCSLESSDHSNGIHIWGYCSNPTKVVREVIKGINDKKLLNIDDEVKDVTIYASKENIEIIKNNRIKALERYQQYEDSIKSYEEEIASLQEKNEEYRIRIYELESEIELYKEN